MSMRKCATNKCPNQVRAGPQRSGTGSAGQELADGMNKRQELEAARDMEADCTIGAGAGFGKYTREVAERLRGLFCWRCRAKQGSRKKINYANYPYLKKPKSAP